MEERVKEKVSFDRAQNTLEIQKIQVKHFFLTGEPTLTLSYKTNFGLFQIERVWRQQF